MFWTRWRRQKKLRQQTLLLTSLLSRWIQVREDLLYAFEKTLDSGLGEPMRGVVDVLLTRIQGGMAVEDALDLMRDEVDCEHFQDLILAMKFNFRCRGDLPSLLEQMEAQLFKIEEEKIRRKISSARDRRLSWLIVALGPATALFRLLTDAGTREALWGSTTGHLVFVSGLALSVIAALLLGLMQCQLSKGG